MIEQSCFFLIIDNINGKQNNIIIVLLTTGSPAYRPTGPPAHRPTGNLPVARRASPSLIVGCINEDVLMLFGRLYTPSVYAIRGVHYHAACMPLCCSIGVAFADAAAAWMLSTISRSASLHPHRTSAVCGDTSIQTGTIS